MNNMKSGAERFLIMRVKVIFFLLVGLLMLSACGLDTETKELVPEDRVTVFEPLCDTTRHIGMFVAAFSSDGDGVSGVVGYSMPMTPSQYEEECSKYEK